MSTFKAAVLYNTGQSLIIEDQIEIPRLHSGQILVKIAYSGVCHSQIMEVRGKRGEDRYLPHMLGHEGTGIVVDIGANVNKVKPGDYVVLTWIKGLGADVDGAIYSKGNRTINSGPVTTFNEYSVVSENRCVKLPDKVPLDVAVLFGCAFPTGAGIIINELCPKADSSIAFFGLGGIGLCALIVTRSFACKTVIAVDVEDNKLHLAKELGATHFINASQEGPIEKIMEITNDEGADYSIEAAGKASTIEQAFKSVRKQGGLCVFASHPKEGDFIQLDPHDLLSGKQVRGTWGGGCLPDRDIPRFAELYLSGELPLEKILTHRYPLQQINKALDDLEQQKIGRALIEIDKTL
ncbi:zinc-binding dehydrogenase [Thermodesulfobacteriota bacterium]